MTELFESKIKDALKGLNKVNTPSCLDTNTIGLYFEGKLSEGEKERCKKHIESCLYCVEQLNEMERLLYYHDQEASISPQLIDRLKNINPNHPSQSHEKNVSESSMFKWIKGIFTFPLTQWRYSLVGFASAALAILITFAALKPERQIIERPNVNLNSFVNISAISSDGRIMSNAQGVIVNSKGLIASNLAPLVKASAVQVTLKDGTKYQTRNIWMDENRNLAVMKIDNEKLPSVTVADISQINIGEKVFMFDEMGRGRNGVREAVVSDFKSFSARHREGEIQYIQLASFTAQLNKGALVDKDGKLIGLAITAERNINLAAPLNDVENFVKGRKAIPVTELRQVRFSTDALNFYAKGILARDAQKWDEAIEYFKKALDLNPDLEGTHLELGYAYYRKQMYDSEAKEYEEVLRINDHNADALSALASNFMTKGRYDDAIKEFKKAVAIDPTDAETLYELGLAYIAQGQKSKALDVYSRLRVLDPGSAEILRKLSIGK